jgi:hypothetical protein
MEECYVLLEIQYDGDNTGYNGVFCVALKFVPWPAYKDAIT